jgi:hypothetical protein
VGGNPAHDMFTRERTRVSTGATRTRNREPCGAQRGRIHSSIDAFERIST